MPGWTEDCEPPSIGLALGSGGAGGLAHIAMLGVFEDLGLKPDAVAGTSIGAIIGALQAAGLRAAEIHELFREFGGSALDPLSGFAGDNGAPGWRDLLEIDLENGGFIDADGFLDFIVQKFDACDFSELETPLQRTQAKQGRTAGHYRSAVQHLRDHAASDHSFKNRCESTRYLHQAGPGGRAIAVFRSGRQNCRAGAWRRRPASRKASGCEPMRYRVEALKTNVFDLPYAPFLRREELSGSVVVVFRDHLHRICTCRYAQDAGPSETPQTPGLATQQQRW
ncbi:MAG: patatin-like phospholipase family protein [Wenzhouxiangellaceae bacterium]|nr:patatin-like phospholipase family protein [Wenzhouxiangellaceae bacterium]